MIALAFVAAFLSAGDDGVTSVETEALHSSTLPIDEANPAWPNSGAGSTTSAPEIEGLRSPSTLWVAGSPEDAAVSTPPTPLADGSQTTSSIAGSTSTITSVVTTDSSTVSTTGNTAASTTPTSAPTSAPPTTLPTTTAPPTTASSTTNTAASCRGSNEFERVFRDDFNGDRVSNSWNQYDSVGNAGFGLRRPSAISVSNGRLVITAEMVDGKLVSGGMAHRYDQTYGKYVFRVRVDEDPDLATSGVVLTWPQSEQHPRDGENNIYETLNYTVDRDPFYTVIHKPFGTYTDHIVHNHNADASQFQTMTMEWKPDGINIIREGPGFAGTVEQWFQPETPEDWIPDVPHHITIQLDAWKQSMSGTVLMEVDFVEVYQYCG